MAERDRLAERVPDAARQRQARLELTDRIADSTAGEPDPADHDPDHGTAERIVELVGDLEGTAGALFSAIEVGRLLRELGDGERREREGLAAPVALPPEVVDARAMAGTTDMSDVRQ